jgi:hypothetical protein
MSRNRWRFSKSTIAVGVFALAVGLLAALTALIAGGPATGPGMGLVDDWTHHHLVFSNPGTAADALAQGRVEQWYRIVNDPRYIMQQMKRNPRQRALATAPDFSTLATRLSAPIRDWWPIRKPPAPTPRETLKRDWSMDLGGSAKVGAGRFPAKYSFSTTTASCTDFVVYNTGVAGSNTGTKQANVIAYDNIYSGCSSDGNVPKVYWSYYTGTGAAVTSVVLSGNGTQVAFIESPSSGAATLRILKWVASQGTDFSAPVAPTNLYTNGATTASGNTAWSTCPSGQSCMISVAFQSPDANPDTTSSPFYDYTNDAIYVGDSKGYLHKFTGVFLGTPGEVTGGGTSSGWPQQMSSTNPLASPVYDPNYKCPPTNCSGGTVFIGPTGSGGGQNFHSIAGVGGSSNITTYSSTPIVNGSSTGIVDGPILDPSASRVYVFVNDDTGGNAGVWQLPESLASATEATLGTGSLSGSLYSGSFDNAYFTSASSSSPTGHLWVCGNSGGDPALYPIPISGSSGMTTGAITAGPVVSGTATPCSPVTEFCTNSGAACTSSAGADYIFVSPQTQPSSSPVTGCTASEGCVQSYTLNTSGSTATLLKAGAFPGGASGMVVDTQNTSTSGTLQLYFGILSTESCGISGDPGYGTGGCAIQASQTAP